MKVYSFVYGLSHSRMRYVEYVTSLDSVVFLNCLYRAFEYMGGVPKKVIFDNAKVVVSERVGSVIRFRCRNRWAELEKYIQHERLKSSLDSYIWLFHEMGVLHRTLAALDVTVPRPLVATYATPEKKWFVLGGSLVLMLSLVANVFLYKQHNNTRQYVELAIRNASGLLQSSATMQIMTNTLNNSTQVRDLQVGEAASVLASVAPFLDELGIHHLEGIASVLTGDSFPLMYPNQMRNVNTYQMLTLVRFSSKQLNSCFQNGTLDFNKLQTTIDDIYQEMPAEYRQQSYNDTY